MSIRIAVLITCHNRREKTLACLKSVFGQRLNDELCLSVYVVDDGSVDGTYEAIKLAYPSVRLIKGDGNLYWNGGMRVAYAESQKQDYDYYLWLNDDAVLYENAFLALVNVHAADSESEFNSSIIVGSTCDPIKRELTYGGWKKTSSANPFRMVKVAPSAERPIECDTVNGNCVLVPREVKEKVGNLDSVFTHGMGDMDYGLRAKKAGCSIWIAPGYVGTSELNAAVGLFTDEALPLLVRWKRMVGPKGLPPKEWLVFTCRHAGWLWPLYWINPYVKFWARAGISQLTSGLGKIFRSAG